MGDKDPKSKRKNMQQRQLKADASAEHQRNIEQKRLERSNNQQGFEDH
jgi:hypothetical protein